MSGPTMSMTDRISKAGFNETQSVPSNHKDSAISNLRTFDTNFKNVTGALVSIGRNITLIHGKLQGTDTLSKSVTSIEQRLGQLENKLTDTHTMLMTIHSLLLSGTSNTHTVNTNHETCNKTYDETRDETTSSNKNSIDLSESFIQVNSDDDTRQSESLPKSPLTEMTSEHYSEHASDHDLIEFDLDTKEEPHKQEVKVEEPEVKPVAEPEVKPVAEPEVKPVAEPEVKPEVKTSTSSELEIEFDTDVLVETPVKPVEVPVVEPVSEPVEVPEQHAEVLLEEPTNVVPTKKSKTNSKAKTNSKTKAKPKGKSKA